MAKIRNAIQSSRFTEIRKRKDLLDDLIHPFMTELFHIHVATPYHVVGCYWLIFKKIYSTLPLRNASYLVFNSDLSCSTNPTGRNLRTEIIFKMWILSHITQNSLQEIHNTLQYKQQQLTKVVFEW